MYLLTIFAVSHFIFDPSYLYYELKWLDIPMHIMGGFGVASLTAAILSYADKPVSFKNLFIAYSVVALGWELYEYANDILTHGEQNALLDSASDYINGLLGTFVAYLFIRK